MAGQRLGLPALGMAMPVIVAGLDLGGGPAQAEQDGRLLEQQPGGGVEGRLGQERQGGQGPEQERDRRSRPAARSTGRRSRASKTPSSMCRATNSSSGPEAIVVAIRGRSPASQRIEDRLLVLTKPLDLHGAPPWCA